MKLLNRYGVKEKRYGTRRLSAALGADMSCFNARTHLPQNALIMLLYELLHTAMQNICMRVLPRVAANARRFCGILWVLLVQHANSSRLYWHASILLMHP